MSNGIFDKKEDIMWPKPTMEQIELWDEIEKSLNEKNIELNTNFSALSDELRTHFASIKTVEKIIEISVKYQLSEKSTSQLSYIIAMVLLGKLNIVDFVKILQKNYNLEREQARQLARDINSEIFLPVKDDLKKIHNISEWPRENENKESNIPQFNGNIVNLKEK